jgi:cellulose synthase (UDP-forming)
MSNFLSHLPILRPEEKYRYAIKHSLWFKVLYIISLVFWFLALYGILDSFQGNVLLSLIYLPVFVFLTIFYLVSKLINLRFKPFAIRPHKLKQYIFWKSIKSKPTIGILLPIAGEEVEVVKNTWYGVKQLAEKYGNECSVLVLDDAGETKYEVLSKEFGFQYLSRSDRGVNKKSGNLRYGLQHSIAEFVIIFDADFRPSIDFIDELLPYMEDRKVGIVQSPQYFEVSPELHKHSSLQYGAGNIQEYFYKIIQNSRGTLGGSICVGTNAIYRRIALNEIGGTALREHSEDVWTGFKMISKGWKIQYIPVILAKGLCPDDIYSFFKQQTRWCSGSMSLFTSREFWLSPISWQTKLPYISGFLFYISHLLALLIPFQIFALLLNNSFNPTIQTLYVALPTIVNAFIILYFHQYPKARIGTLLAFVTASWAYSYAIFSTVFKIPEAWTPTGSSQKISSGFIRLLIFSTCYFVVYISLISFTIFQKQLRITEVRFELTMFWMLINIIAQTTYLYGLWRFVFTQVKPLNLLSEKFVVYKEKFIR